MLTKRSSRFIKSILVAALFGLSWTGAHAAQREHSQTETFAAPDGTRVVIDTATVDIRIRTADCQRGRGRHRTSHLRGRRGTSGAVHLEPHPRPPRSSDGTDQHHRQPGAFGFSRSRHLDRTHPTRLSAARLRHSRYHDHRRIRSPSEGIFPTHDRSIFEPPPATWNSSAPPRRSISEPPPATPDWSSSAPSIGSSRGPHRATSASPAAPARSTSTPPPGASGWTISPATPKWSPRPERSP